MSGLTDKKFIIPPIIAGVSFLLADLPSLPAFNIENRFDIVAVLIGTPIIVLGIGFLISTCGYFLLIQIYKDSPVFKREQEFEIWQKLEKSGEFVRNQIEKRFNMVTLNFNSFVGLGFSIIFVFLTHKSPVLFWWVLNVLFLALFFKNSSRILKDVEYFETQIKLIN